MWAALHLAPYLHSAPSMRASVLKKCFLCMDMREQWGDSLTFLGTSLTEDVLYAICITISITCQAWIAIKNSADL